MISLRREWGSSTDLIIKMQFLKGEQALCAAQETSHALWS